MRSSVWVFVFAGILGLAQGSAVHTKRAEATAVQYSSCNTDEISTLAEELEANVMGLMTDLTTDVNDVISDSEDCVEAFLSDLDVTGLVSCASDVAESAVNSISYTVQVFVDETEYTVGQLVKQIVQCFKL